MTDKARPVLVALYDIRPGNGVLQPRSPHGAMQHVWGIWNCGPHYKLVFNFLTAYNNWCPIIAAVIKLLLINIV